MADTQHLCLRSISARRTHLLLQAHTLHLASDLLSDLSSDFIGGFSRVLLVAKDVGVLLDHLVYLVKQLLITCLLNISNGFEMSLARF